MSGSNRYRPLSMIVELDDEYRAPNIFALTGPSDWQPELSRRIFHETVHYWQHISQGFLIRMVDEDWRRLRRFGGDGSIVPTGPFKRKFVERDPAAQFSARDLMECHARFWDVQALGPPNLIELELDDPGRDTDRILTRPDYDRLKAEGKIWREIDAQGRGRGYSGLSFDIAMRLAAGRYAMPYLLLRDTTDTLTASAIFPLCAYFAMQSPDPVPFYVALVDRVANEVAFESGVNIETVWRRLFPLFLREALLLHTELHGEEFSAGPAIVLSGELADHPGYYLANTMLVLARRHIDEFCNDEFLALPPSMPDELRALWTLDFLLGCCGMTDCRQPELLCFLSPPLVRFKDGRGWILGAEFDRLQHYNPPATVTSKQGVPRRNIAEALTRIDAHWNQLADARFGL